ncbi:MAG TPA: class I SAM-dependent methyltransferase [Bryobacteraceae bacterium]|nr:class I SAM-dependent methyltransferase [Bryobacteraceae bacterium]
MPAETDYILGTHDEEIARLGLQHNAWKARALDAWKSAGIRAGQTVLDVGSGPGYASMDLADLVGPSGCVVAIEKSHRFLAALEDMRRQRGIRNITPYQADLEAGAFPTAAADGAWCRWVLAFVNNPRDVLAWLSSALRHGGVIVLHEYFDYATWRAAPRCPEIEEFVTAVMASWRDVGGEPDIGLQAPGWLEQLGCELRVVRPLIDVVQPGHPSWAWLRAFVEVGRARLVDLGYLSEARAGSIWRAFLQMEASPGARMISPGVLEIVAQRA